MREIMDNLENGERGGWREGSEREAERERGKRAREWEEEEGWEMIHVTWDEGEKGGLDCGSRGCGNWECCGFKSEDLRMEKIDDFELEFGRSLLSYVEN